MRQRSLATLELKKNTSTLVDSKAGRRSDDLSPLSKELVIGLVGYAGAGCSTAARRLRMLLDGHGYQSTIIKLSSLIEARLPDEDVTEIPEGPGDGVAKLERARQLQDAGDALRRDYGGYAVAALAIKKIKELRGEHSVGVRKHAYILDSLKHQDEVKFLRRVYDQSFRLIAVHCESKTRRTRLVGKNASAAKYRGAKSEIVLGYMARDEKDRSDPRAGQQVLDAFYLADYFMDNNSAAQEGVNLNDDLDRFLSLLLGSGLVRPTVGERAMYHAHAAALQSSCLSRQVGAALISKTGELLATGTNDVPKFGGGVYGEGGNSDGRCFMWPWGSSEPPFKGCHNDRKKAELRGKIATWLGDNCSSEIAEAIFPTRGTEIDLSFKERERAAVVVKEFFEKQDKKFDSLPGIRELIEFSRSIHAEMDALISAARAGISPVDASLYCTTYPCHSCARHLITAGIRHVYYIEPYVKSLATELHSDSIDVDVFSNPVPSSVSSAANKLTILPFTGVGPRMYEDYFTKKIDLKGDGGVFVPPVADTPAYAVRLQELMKVEEAAAALVPEV